MSKSKCIGELVSLLLGFYSMSIAIHYTAPTVNPFKWSPIDVLTVAQVALQNFNVILLELAFLTLYSRS